MMAFPWREGDLITFQIEAYKSQRCETSKIMGVLKLEFFSKGQGCNFEKSIDVVQIK